MDHNIVLCAGRDAPQAADRQELLTELLQGCGEFPLSRAQHGLNQGHIPLKVVGFVYNKDLGRWDAVAGVNVTLGLPIIRASVDHGTAFGHAGTGVANELSLVNAMDYAIRMANAKKNVSAVK